MYVLTQAELIVENESNVFTLFMWDCFVPRHDGHLVSRAFVSELDFLEWTHY